MLATNNVNSGFLQKLRRFIRRHEMLLGGEPVLVAVSGGIDSMVLLDMLIRLAPTMNLTLGVAHYDHGLRGEASKQDAQFVIEWARNRGLKVYVGHGDVRQIADDHKLSIEEAARRARYTFLRKVARKHRFPVVVTGHTANDNAETVLLNLVRGSGVRGLAAIPPVRQMGEGVILGRPLLDFERSEVERYAKEMAIEWREDESNESSKFLRNRLRSELLPLLQQYNPSIVGTLNTTAEIMRNLEQYLSQSVQSAIERVIVEKSKERLALNLHQIKHFLPAMQTEIVQRGVSQAFDIPPISFNATERALALLYRETGQKTDLGAGLTALRDRDTLVVLRELPLPPEIEHPFVLGEDIEVGRVRLRSSAVPRDKVQFSRNGRVEFFDADKLPPNLIVRSWREGDRFRPLGMEGEKKVSDFLVDAKTPRDRKRHVLVLASDSDIVWVCGMRIDERYKVTDETTNAIRVEMVLLPASGGQVSQAPSGDRPERGRGRGQEARRDEGRRDDRRRDDRGREESARDERGRDDRARDDRARDERGRDDRARDDRGRDDRSRDDRARDDRGRDDRGRADRGRDERGRDDRARDERSDEPRRDEPRRDDRREGRRDDRRRDDRREPRRDERAEEPRADERTERRADDERPREDRPREERPREERPQEERAREERPRDERREPRRGDRRGGRDDRGRGDRRDERQGPEPRDERRDEVGDRPDLPASDEMIELATPELFGEELDRADADEAPESRVDVPADEPVTPPAAAPRTRAPRARKTAPPVEPEPTVAEDPIEVPPPAEEASGPVEPPAKRPTRRPAAARRAPRPKKGKGGGDAPPPEA
jgi:tRNA(Ile)-lysidine synthase